MKIINPLYDKAFKYLMENEKYARQVLSVILDTEIEELSLGQQETVAPDEKRGLTLFRLDFKAVVRKTDGTKHKVLIELQKSKFSTDIRRFRAYLGANYLGKENTRVAEEPAKYGFSKHKDIYPIITIYILGYNLDDLPYMAVRVNRKIINSITKKEVKVESDFVNHLTHQSHVIQVRRLPEKRKTRLEQFLVFFNQAWCTHEPYIIDLQDVPAGFEDIAKYLQVPVLSESFRQQLEAEQEIDEIFDEQELKYLKKIEKAEKEKKEALEKEKQAMKQIEQEQKEKKELQYKTAKELKELGFSADKISGITGLSSEEIGKM
mgnify:CR=1 FL=1